jgi:hypothetical protein
VLSSTSTLLISRALSGPDSFTEFRMAQAAWMRFEDELKRLGSTKRGRHRSIYRYLVVHKGPVDAMYERQEWERSAEGYRQLSIALSKACVIGSRSALECHAAKRPVRRRPLPSPQRRSTHAERAGALGVNTFEDPWTLKAQGPRIRSNQSVRVACRLYAPSIQSVMPDGYWYRIASKPWGERFWAPANSFWNGDVPGQEPYVHNTDFSVPVC